jgi:phosphatidylglycerophosphate synthase
MKAVLAIPGCTDPCWLSREICGVSLLARTLATAQRAGVREFLILWSDNMARKAIKCRLQSPPLKSVSNFHFLSVNGFDPDVQSSWSRVSEHLPERFIWMPWNWVTDGLSVKQLPLCRYLPLNWREPALVEKNAVVHWSEVPLHSEPPIPEAEARIGVAVTSEGTAKAAERLIVRRSGKALDGIHTSFNRRLCWPMVRWLSHTSLTPNGVTLGGVVVSVLSCLFFARGTYWSSVTGALLFFVAGLFDEMDGMLARVQFADSPFGTWFEGVADGLSYLLLFGGIAAGLYRLHGTSALIAGMALLCGTVISLVVLFFQRKRATHPDRPHEHLGKFYSLLEKDSSNLVSRVVRQIQPFQKRGVLIHYVVLFTVCGGLHALIYLAILGSHLTWSLALYFNGRFYRDSVKAMVQSNARSAQEAI